MKQRQHFIKMVLAATICSVTAMTATTGQAKQYYKWVDSKGSTHYTTTPPPKTARSKSKVDTYGYRGGATQATQPAQANHAQNTQPNNQATTPTNNQPNTQPTNTVPTVNAPSEQPKVTETNTNHNQQNRPAVDK